MVGDDAEANAAVADLRLAAVNKLVRQYITKDTDIGRLTDKYIERIRKKINSRPRKKLNFKTPKHEFYKQFEHLA